MDEDGTIHDTLDEGLNGVRATDNTYLYYDGTLSNRRVGTAQTQATRPGTPRPIRRSLKTSRWS